MVLNSKRKDIAGISMRVLQKKKRTKKHLKREKKNDFVGKKTVFVEKNNFSNSTENKEKHSVLFIYKINVQHIILLTLYFSQRIRYYESNKINS